MSILTKEERENLRIVDGSSITFWSSAGLNDALDTIDALEKEWAVEVQRLRASDIRCATLARTLDALEARIDTIHGIAHAHHDTRTVGGAHAALREILAVIEGADDAEDLPKACSKCSGTGFIQTPCADPAHRHGHAECPSCPGGWGLVAQQCDVCAADGEGER